MLAPFASKDLMFALIDSLSARYIVPKLAILHSSTGSNNFDSLIVSYKRGYIKMLSFFKDNIIIIHNFFKLARILGGKGDLYG